MEELETNWNVSLRSVNSFDWCHVFCLDQEWSQTIIHKSLQKTFFPIHTFFNKLTFLSKNKNVLTFKWSVQKEEQLNCISYLLSMPTVDIKDMHTLIDIMFKGHTQMDTAWLSHLKGKKKMKRREEGIFFLFMPLFNFPFLQTHLVI